MGGIGISVDSQETESSPSTPRVSLPPEVVEHIASKLGIMTAETKQALSEISLLEGVAVTITRKKNNDQLTIKKQPGGSPYDVTYKGSTTKIDIDGLLRPCGAIMATINLPCAVQHSHTCRHFASVGGPALSRLSC